MSSYSSKKKKKKKRPEKPIKYPHLSRHPYWRIFMIANPIFLIVMCTIIVLQIIPWEVGLVITVIGYIALWQLVRIARRDVAQNAGTAKKKR